MSPALYTPVEALALPIFCCATQTISQVVSWPGRRGQLESTWREPALSEQCLVPFFWPANPPIARYSMVMCVGNMSTDGSTTRGLTPPTTQGARREILLT